MKMNDFSGKRFGRWTALFPIRKIVKSRSRIYWHCLCDCGTERTVESSSLSLGKSESCGCLAIEKTILTKTKHGHSPKAGWSGTYQSWRKMLERCRNKNDVYHKKYYIDRGIVVCKHWYRFENFLSDMGDRPPGKSLDRINIDGNYEPGNCRWATHKEQMNNTRRNKRCQTRS